MSIGVPILRENNMLELLNQFVDRTDHVLAIGHGQSSAGTEIVLDVHYDQRRIG
jgi:hypothetical protein